MIDYGLVCSVCGDPAISRIVRDEPVLHAENGRRLAWARTIATYRHADGREHRVPIGVAFEVTK